MLLELKGCSTKTPKNVCGGYKNAKEHFLWDTFCNLYVLILEPRKSCVSSCSSQQSRPRQWPPVPPPSRPPRHPPSVPGPPLPAPTPPPTRDTIINNRNIKQNILDTTIQWKGLERNWIIWQICFLKTTQKIFRILIRRIILLEDQMLNWTKYLIWSYEEKK